MLFAVNDLWLQVFLTQHILLALVVFKFDEATGSTSNVSFLVGDIAAIILDWVDESFGMLECSLTVIEQVSSKLHRRIIWSLFLLDLHSAGTEFTFKLDSLQKVEQLRLNSFHILQTVAE